MDYKQRLNRLKLNSKFTLVMVLLAVILIIVMGGLLFHNMNENVIDENISYMQHTMERNKDNITRNIDSVNMTTQFVLSDDALLYVLNCSVDGTYLSTKELLEFYNENISSLEKLVNNNMLLYGVRVYASNDSVQEMMPILYRNSRMQKMDWAKEDMETTWEYAYQDKLFDLNEKVEKNKIVSLITPIDDFVNGQIGVIETAVSMSDMFPVLYEEIENEWSCLITDEGELYLGNYDEEETAELITNEIQEIEKSETVLTEYKRRDGMHLIVSSVYIKEMGCTLVSVQDISDSVRQLYQLGISLIGVMILLVIGLAVIINAIVKHLLKEFYIIIKSIRNIQKGDLSVRIPESGSDEMGELGRQINIMLNRIEQLMKESIDREVLVKNSEIRALQNQINAHFIYNVLESIKMMAEIDEEYAISDAITSLGKLLRYSMRWVSGNVRVYEEVEYIKDYLALLNLRFDYEIYLSLNMPEIIMQQEIPKMSLQPIIENAIYHGIEELAEDTTIYMKGIIEGEDCVIEITDAGKGMTEEEIQVLEKKIAGEIETSGGSGNGIGLKNVQDRIHISFGDKYGMSFASKIGCFTKVSVRIPMRFGQKGESYENSIDRRR